MNQNSQTLEGKKINTESPPIKPFSRPKGGERARMASGMRADTPPGGKPAGRGPARRVENRLGEPGPPGGKPAGRFRPARWKTGQERPAHPMENRAGEPGPPGGKPGRSARLVRWKTGQAFPCKTEPGSGRGRRQPAFRPPPEEKAPGRPVLVERPSRRIYPF